MNAVDRHGAQIEGSAGLTALLLAARAEHAKKQQQRLTSQNSPPSEDMAAADLEPSAVELPPQLVP